MEIQKREIVLTSNAPADWPKGIPSFVIRKLCALLEEYYYPIPFEELTEDQQTIRYLILPGCTDPTSGDALKSVSFWTASDENTFLIHLGGSAYWITPGSHELDFSAIDEALLPKHPNLSTWWVIAYPNEKETFAVAQIKIVPASEVPPGTWHMGIEN